MVPADRAWLQGGAARWGTARSAPSLEVSHCEHVTIIEAIAAQNPELARTAMRDHLTTRFDALRQEMDPADAAWASVLFDPDTGA